MPEQEAVREAVPETETPAVAPQPGRAASSVHYRAAAARVASTVQRAWTSLPPMVDAPERTMGNALHRSLESTPGVAADAGESATRNDTGLPDSLKSGVEQLSGFSLDSVRVHYNSPEPAGLRAHAFARGGEIHVAPAQEQHLPHEAWHLVQQAQGRVAPTTTLAHGVVANNDNALEREATTMGARAAAWSGTARESLAPMRHGESARVLQPVLTRKGDAEDPMTDDEVEALVLAHPDQEEEIRHSHAADEVYIVRESRSGALINEAKPISKKRGAGGMYGRMGDHEPEDHGLQNLAFAASSTSHLAKLEEDLGTETVGDVDMDVRKVTTKRVAKHQPKFAGDTGHASAKVHAEAFLAGLDGLDWDITHLKGYAQVGPISDRQDENLVAATKSANTEMMFFDNEVTGRTDVVIKTVAEVFKGTRIAKTITMKFASKAAPDSPFFERVVYGIRPEMTREEAARLREEARVGVIGVLDAIDGILALDPAK